MTDCNEIQKDEIVALESIYNSEEFLYNIIDEEYHCTLNVFLTLPNGYYLKYRDLENENSVDEKIFINYLPPIILYIILPFDYPTKSSPKLTINCSWLSRNNLIKLWKHLYKLWFNAKQEILFIWTFFLQNELLDFLNIKISMDLSKLYTVYKYKQDNKNKDKKFNVKNNVNNNRYKKKSKSNCNKRGSCNERIRILSFNGNPIQALMDYDENKKIVEFQKNFYTCKICFLDKLGESCSQFKPCSHIFCKDCITKYLQVKIQDGTVTNISCPEEKCFSEASPDQIKDLVTPELFEKYDSTLLSVTLNTMPDIIYCPRRHCHYPVSKEPDEKMATCPACQYTFCIYCKMVYHGVADCHIMSAEKDKLVKKYTNGSKQEKLELERRYGKNQLETLVNTTLSENWIQNNSHKCPKCKTAIEKLDGCNKMTCGRCNTFFCWLCGSLINTENPYLHYQDSTSACYQKLFFGILNNDNNEDDDVFDLDYHPEFESDEEFDDYYDENFFIDLDI